MALKVINPPAQVIPTAELRSYCKYDDTSRDAVLLTLLEAARKLAEHHTRCSIGAQVLELALDSFPSDYAELLQGPVTGITSVKYLDTSGVEQTLSSTGYVLNDYKTPARLQLAYGATWPGIRTTTNAVKIRYAAGSDTIDAAIRGALLLTVAHWDKNPAAVGTDNLAEVPLGVKTLLGTVKDWS